MTDPTIYGREESGLVPDGGFTGGVRVDTNKYGPLGDPDYVTIHHAAGPRAYNKERCEQLNRQYQRDHVTSPKKLWGDIGYHFCMDDLGRLYRLRSTKWKGTHVGGANTANVGILIHGNYEYNELTESQRVSLRWLFQGGFYKLFGEPEAGIFLVRGHKEWPGHHSNQCPGDNLMRHLAWLRSVEDY
jgi:hypothetical protein